MHPSARHVSLRSRRFSRASVMFPSARGGSVVSATGEAPLKSLNAPSPNDSSRPLRSCTSRLSRGEKQKDTQTSFCVLRNSISAIE